MEILLSYILFDNEDFISSTYKQILAKQSIFISKFLYLLEEEFHMAESHILFDGAQVEFHVAEVLLQLDHMAEVGAEFHVAEEVLH